MGQIRRKEKGGEKDSKKGKGVGKIPGKGRVWERYQERERYGKDSKKGKV